MFCGFTINTGKAIFLIDEGHIDVPKMRVRQADKLQQREMPEMRRVHEGCTDMDQREIFHMKLIFPRG